MCLQNLRTCNPCASWWGVPACPRSFPRQLYSAPPELSPVLSTRGPAESPVQHDSLYSGVVTPRGGFDCPLPPCARTTRSPAVLKPKDDSSVLRLASCAVGFISLTGGEGGEKAVFLENGWLRRVCYSVVFKCIALTSSGFVIFVVGAAIFLWQCVVWLIYPATCSRMMEGTASKHSRSDALGN